MTFEEQMVEMVNYPEIQVNHKYVNRKGLDVYIRRKNIAEACAVRVI